MRTTITIRDSLETLPFFEGMPPEDLEFLAGCAAYARYKSGDFLLLSGQNAEAFYVLLEGDVALEMAASNRTLTAQTLHGGDVLGWSWLVPPYQWHFDARALGPLSTIRFDAVCLRDKLENNPRFGYEMYKRIVQIITQRLHERLVQVMDVYQ